ncbi:MAG: hypothetical protein [Bacteriophage sp.]|nr:MAG: hypothetical protein [Bacteriophage sp.]
MLILSRIGVHRTGTALFHMKGMIMDDETTGEWNTAERDDLTLDEAHRAGEFDDLRDILTSITDKLNDALERIGAIDERIDGIYDKFADSVSQMVENGATVSEDDAAEAIAEAAANDLENLDYTL